MLLRIVPRIAIFLTAIVQMLSGDILYGVFCLLALAITLVPSLVMRRVDAGIPLVLELGLLWLMVSDMTLGNSLGFYRLPWYDKGVHLGSSMLVGMIGFLAITVLRQPGKTRFHLWVDGLAILLVTLGVGALWEISEYVVDQVFGRAAQGSVNMNALDDTMVDLILDGVGGVVAAIVGPLYLRRSQRARDELRELVDMVPA